MSQQTDRSSEERALSKHILPSSGTMIGVCATLIGLVKLAEAHIGPSRVDEYAALASLLFLASAIASYISMRHLDRTRLSARCEIVADQCFLAGLSASRQLRCFSPMRSSEPSADRRGRMADQFETMARTRRDRLSRSNGLVIISMPGCRKPSAIATLSA